MDCKNNLLSVEMLSFISHIFAFTTFAYVFLGLTTFETSTLWPSKNPNNGFLDRIPLVQIHSSPKRSPVAAVAAAAGAVAEAAT